MCDIVQVLYCIVDIISVIDGIVFQISILVLNVVVEVVCVGEQGCSFVVVVSEVWLLVQCSVDVVCQIKGLIEVLVDIVVVGMC